MPRRNPLLRFLSWLGSHELAVLLAIGGIAGGVWLFAALAEEVGEGDSDSIDRGILMAMRRPGTLEPLGPPVLHEVARDITALGGIFILGSLTGMTAAFLALDGKRRMALFVLGCVVSGVLVSAGLKELFQRPRPDLVPHGSYVSSPSFPSGHSMMSAVTYLALGALLARSQERRRLKAFFLLSAGLLTFVVGLSRVYLGVHWPSDVLAGWTAGAVWALVCWLAARRLQVAHTIEREAEHDLGGAAGENP
jgi:undecaprenyl-diphosphatase